MSKYRIDTCIAVIGLGYVGLTLAVEFAKKFKTIGFDLSKTKISNFKSYNDPTGEITSCELKTVIENGSLEVTSNQKKISLANFIIVAVPTPIDDANNPNLGPLKEATAMVGEQLKPGSIVVFESTVYPGTTEEICIPILEEKSKLVWKKSFNVGYSPERINPGDKKRTLTKITKVVSGDSEETLNKIDKVYSSIIKVGTYRASSLKVAEAAKVIENTQRDLNIALMNELAIIFNKLQIDTNEVIDTAKTKWNFLPFRPGLVGGHCIGVDPYYLTHKAEMIGYHPEVILSGRRINDGMAAFIAKETIKKIIDSQKNIKKSKVSVLGFTFKEDCPDIRNSKVADLIQEIEDFGCKVSVHDPIADAEDTLHDYGINLCNWKELFDSDVIIAAVSHENYLKMPITELTEILKPGGIFVDIKGAYPAAKLLGLGFQIWRL